MAPYRILILAVLALGTHAYASEFTIDDWDLTSSVLTDGVGREGTSFDEVMNPFSDSHQIQLRVSSASASYDFAWNAEGGHFSIESQLAAELVSGGSNRASSHGWIRITPSVDLAFHVDGTMDFDLPGHIMKAEMDVRAGGGFQIIFNGYRQHDTLSDGLGSGTLSSGGDFILSAGRTWSLVYGFSVDTYDYEPIPGSVGEIGTGAGSVSFSFTVLPEPSTAGLLATSGIMMLRRRRRA